MKHFLPPHSWRLPVGIVISIFIGLFAFIFYISNASSYLSDDPKTCVNCHIMAPEYATWMHSSHRQWTNCNDCHVPHNNVFNKYFFKAKDGMRHATMFTLRLEPQVIHIKEAGKAVVQQNCIRCHTNLLTDSKVNSIHAQFSSNREERLCWECHREVPHGRVKSLSSTPHAKVPLLESPVPEWLKTVMKQEKK